MRNLLFLLIISLSASNSKAQSEAGEIFEHNGVSCVISDTNCLKGDFDGNDLNDYSAPMGEGWIYIFMNLGTNSEMVFEVDAGGVTELYGPRNSAGEHGEPVVEYQSILVPWVGQYHVVFTWDGKQFKRIPFPSYYEKR